MKNRKIVYYTQGKTRNYKIHFTHMILYELAMGDDVTLRNTERIPFGEDPLDNWKGFSELIFEDFDVH